MDYLNIIFEPTRLASVDSQADFQED